LKEGDQIMIKKTSHSINKQRSLCAAFFLAFAFMLTQSDKAFAQTPLWVTSGSNNINNTNAGNVGIGTNNPIYKLDVVGAGRFQGFGAAISVVNTGGWTQAIVGRSTGQAAFIAAPGVAYTPNTPYWAMGLGSDNSAGWSLETFDGSTMATRMHVLPNGNVGIGTTAPLSKLHVVGDMMLTGTGTGNISASGTITGGNIVAKYQDIAEWVLARSTTPAGTVVVLDTERNNQVVASQHSYDTRVAGVVSDNPGVILGEAGEGKVKVATTGRVKVKVDATRGPIRIGDLLVTSDKEGIAMRSEPLNLGGTLIHRPGTLIGKALEPLNKGVGEILVLLSLQ
jgi:hypothetical protein